MVEQVRYLSRFHSVIWGRREVNEITIAILSFVYAFPFDSFIQWFAHKKSCQPVCTCILCAPLSIPDGSMDASIGWVEKMHKAKATKCWLKIVGLKLFHITNVSVIDTSRSMLEFGRRTRRKLKYLSIPNKAQQSSNTFHSFAYKFFRS